MSCYPSDILRESYCLPVISPLILSAAFNGLKPDKSGDSDLKDIILPDMRKSHREHNLFYDYWPHEILIEDYES